MYISSDEDLERFLNDEDAVVMIDQYISKLEMVSCTFVGVEVTEKKDAFIGISNFFLVVAFMSPYYIQIKNIQSEMQSLFECNEEQASTSSSNLPFPPCFTFSDVCLSVPIRTEYEP